MFDDLPSVQSNRRCSEFFYRSIFRHELIYTDYYLRSNEIKINTNTRHIIRTWTPVHGRS